MEIKEILSLLPHRFPFIMIDRVVSIEPQKITGIKNVSANEPYFPGHFPDNPIMPGVLIIEAMAQLGGIYAMSKRPEHSGKVAYFLGIDNARFRKPVVPGDQLVLEANLTKYRMPICQLHCVARVKEDVAAEADIMIGFQDRPK